MRSGLSGNAFSAVRGVFLIGDPEHKAGLACNVVRCFRCRIHSGGCWGLACADSVLILRQDNHDGTTTRNVNGLSVYKGGIPSSWSVELRLLRSILCL
jgi:hypothetical protein